jgi:hypothetical protein
MTALLFYLFLFLGLGFFRIYFGGSRFLDTLLKLVAVYTTFAGVSAQVLSLLRMYNSLGLTICSGIFMILGYLVMKFAKRHDEDAPASSAKFWMRGLELALLALFLISITALVFLGWFVFPWGDNYHWSQLYYWRQHESIVPFFVHNTRITTFSFLYNAIFYPVFISTESARIAVVVNGTIYAFAAFVCFDVCRKLRLPVLASQISVGVLFSSGVFLQVLGAGLSFSVWILLSAGALSFLVSAIFAEGDKDRLRYICLSIWLFGLSVGCKNVAIFGLPFYAVAILWILRPFRIAIITRAIVIGVAALLAGGVVWNYASNLIFYGSLTGERAAEVSHSASLSAFWTGNARGLTSFLDLEPLPFSRSDAARRFNRALVGALGGSGILPGEIPDSHYSYDGNVHGTGLGLLGLLIVLPAMFYGILKPPAWRHLFVFAILYVGVGFVLTHGIVRWSTIGRFRLLPGYFIWAIPFVAHFVARLRFMRFVAPALLCFIFGYQVTKGAAIAVRMNDFPVLMNVEQVRSFVYKRAETATLRRGGEETTVWIRQPGAGEEYRYLGDGIGLNGKRVAYIASGNSVDYFLMENHDAILVPVRSVGDAESFRYLVVEGLAEDLVSVTDEWGEIMSIRSSGDILLGFYERHSSEQK